MVVMGLEHNKYARIKKNYKQLDTGIILSENLLPFLIFGFLCSNIPQKFSFSIS